MNKEDFFKLDNEMKWAEYVDMAHTLRELRSTLIMGKNLIEQIDFELRAMIQLKDPEVNCFTDKAYRLATQDRRGNES